MKLYTCEQCRYTFRYPSHARETSKFLLQPKNCPDCGKAAVRPATEKEIEDYKAMQTILQEEIRLGLYAAG